MHPRSAPSPPKTSSSDYAASGAFPDEGQAPPTSAASGAFPIRNQLLRLRGLRRLPLETSSTPTSGLTSVDFRPPNQAPPTRDPNPYETSSSDCAASDAFPSEASSSDCAASRACPSEASSSDCAASGACPSEASSSDCAASGACPSGACP